MSTRCQIGFYDRLSTDVLVPPDILLYRHSDGYPNGAHGVVATLMPIIWDFLRKRGFWDMQYLAAYVVAQFLGEEHLGIGICTTTEGLHGDIEYYYAVYTDHMRVYRCENDPNYQTMTWLQDINF